MFEIRNAKEANELLLTSFHEKRTFDEAFIKELHLLLTQNTYDTRRWQLGERPGEYKQHDYVTGKEEIGAAPEDVPEEMGELLSELTAVENRNALTAEAYFHAKFENFKRTDGENMGSTACPRGKTPPLVYISIPYHLTRNPASVLVICMDRQRHNSCSMISSNCTIFHCTASAAESIWEGQPL